MDGRPKAGVDSDAAAALRYVRATLEALGARIVDEDSEMAVAVKLESRDSQLLLDFGSGIVVQENCVHAGGKGGIRCYGGLLRSIALSSALESARANAPPSSTASTKSVTGGAGAGGGKSSPESPRLAAIPGSPQPTAFALVVGIEKYRDVPAAQGAAEDLDRYKGLLQMTLGVPEDHVHVIADDRATKGDLEKELDWLKENVPSGGRAYFFYSGHGAPDTATGTPYLVPYDGDPKALARTAVPLSAVMNALQATKGKDALAVVDACFSGSGGRSVLPAGARPLVNVKDAKPTAKLALFTASTGAQISGPALDGKGGLFSQFVAEGLGSAKADMDEDGQVSLAELAQWVKPRVQREAKKDRRDQTPGLVLGAGAGRAEDFVVAYGVKR